METQVKYMIWHWPRERTPSCSTDIKSYSISFITKEVHIKTAMNYYYTIIRLAKFEVQPFHVIGEDMKQPCWHPWVSLILESDFAQRAPFPRHMGFWMNGPPWWYRKWWDGEKGVVLQELLGRLPGWTVGLLACRCSVPSFPLPFSSVGEAIHALDGHSPRLLCCWGYGNWGA